MGIWFHVEDGVLPKQAEDHFQGGPTSVDAKCMNKNCNHIWRVRGATSIDDLSVESTKHKK